jgi:hypothetical protein
MSFSVFSSCTPKRMVASVAVIFFLLVYHSYSEQSELIATA